MTAIATTFTLTPQAGDRGLSIGLCSLGCLLHATWIARWGPDNPLTCTILTTDATDCIRALYTRMPVILAKDGFEPWLSGSDPAIDPGIEAAVKSTPVSPKMDKPSYNEPDCIEPLAT